MNPQKRQFEMMSAVLDRSVKDFGKHLNIEKDVLMDVKDPQRMLFKTLIFKSDRSKCFKFLLDLIDTYVNEEMLKLDKEKFISVDGIAFRRYKSTTQNIYWQVTLNYKKKQFKITIFLGHIRVIL
jgi:hypothetical protein